MSEFTFEAATRDQAKARIALAGPSGSGKTMTALIIATALSDNVALIDTERGSASKYAPPPSRMHQPGPGEFIFARLNMQRYDPRDLPRALAAAAQAGHEVVIVDSLSKFWGGQGGMLEQVDNAAKRGYGGNSFGGWKEARPMETAMLEALLGYPGHVIVTMRTKTAYEVVEDERGRKVPTKIGLKPEQREGIEYEFDIVGDMDLQNAMTISKSRCRALSGMVIQRPDASLGEEILAWLSDGKAALNAIDYRDAAVIPGCDSATLRALHIEVKARGLLGAAVVDDEGETVTLGALIVRKGQEAAKDERGAPAAASPAAGSAGRNGKPPAARAPASDTATPPAVTDQEWLTEFTSRAVTFTTKDEGQALWDERLAKAEAGQCSAEDSERLGALLNERLEEIKNAAPATQPAMAAANGHGSAS